MNETEYREEQIEALKTLVEYSKKLNNGIKIVADEIAGDRKEDTDEFFKKVINGINWELQVLNSCLSFINEKEIVIDKELANSKILELNDAITLKNNQQISDVLKNTILPLMEKISTVSEKLTA